MLLALAILLNVSLFRSAGKRAPVVRVARDVPVGQRIGQADLDVVRVAADSALTTIPERRLREVVGRRAAVGLRRGMLLAGSQLATRPSLQPGQALVTVPLKTSAMPLGLAPGWRVRVVITPDHEQASGIAPHRGRGLVTRDVAAVVDQVEGPDSEGSMTVSLLVADSESSAVAQQAAVGLVVLVVIERRD
ncbi:SAF domain-containing protein [Actinomadura roseirufa]|uniref:SAF domain-containing protein n=1 Tax=Actinomadura roseirufa TaxID=2094049 RepID=UPI001F5E625F|nr:SAF domain-containing protein [Actinomadura roseirufa]